MDRGGPFELSERVQPFAAAIADPDASLGELAAGIAVALDPRIDLVAVLADLDALAASCPTPTRDGVIRHLFASGMFRGDARRYHDWKNSCIDHVLAQRTGMPITLSIVAVEVARRLGVPMVGVGMPGHFLVGDPSDADWFADPFHGTTGLGRDECRRLLASMGARQWSDRYLDPTPDRLVIARVLNNLKMSCERSDDRVRGAITMRLRQELREFARELPLAPVARAPLN